MQKNTEATIEEMNEVIARFMGYYYQAGKFYSNTVYPGRGNWFKNAKYHISWDWLMPIGKKIRDLLDDMQKKRPPHTTCYGDLIEVDIHCAVGEYDIVNAHKHMYTFITWYNKQKQNNEQSPK